MSPPAYHLRSNKAADRFALLEAVRRLPLLEAGGLEEYTYFGLGGPYLEDFRQLYEFCPEMHMVSIENDSEVYKRQKFNLPFRTLELIQEDLSSFINRHDPGDAKSIFWLDYTGLEYRCFLDFKALLGTVADNSMIKITLRSDHRDFWNLKSLRRKKGQAEDFRNEFGQILPEPSDSPPRSPEKFAYLLQEMLQIASQQVLSPAAHARTFIPVSSFYYSDGTWMFTLTGIVGHIDGEESVKRAYINWKFANLEWERPTRISVPVLSTKERLHLQDLLPTETAPRTAPGQELHKRLGYLIEDNQKRTEKALEQYAAFHRYSPYFMRGIP